MAFKFTYLSLLWVVSLPSQAHSHHTIGARKLLEAFPNSKNLRLPFSHPNRTQWHYFPKDRVGISYKAMKEKQKEIANAFLRSWLSPSGWTKLQQIIALESILGGGLFSSYSPERYFFTFFGMPGKNPWGFRFEGHHLSLNFTKKKKESAIDFVPFFWGANPAKHNTGNGTIEPLREEQSLARKLVQSLSEKQRAKAIFSKTPLAEILLIPEKQITPLKPEGISYGGLTPSQRKTLLKLLRTYLNNFSTEIRTSYEKRILQKLISLHFAWAGSTQPGKGHYYRIQGQDFVVEYDNTQNGANHIHTVWHDLSKNFGGNPLRTHYRQEHRYAFSTPTQ